MTVIIARLVVLIISHLIALMPTTFQITDRIKRNSLWFDDVFAIVTGLGTLFIVGVLLGTIPKAPVIAPLEYRLVIGSSFFVIWASKACSVMTMCRVLYGSYWHWPMVVLLFFCLSSILLAVGVAYIPVVLLLCKVDTICPDNTPCYCNVATELVLSALISSAVIDAAIIGLSAYIYMHRLLKRHPARIWIVKTAVICNVAIFVIDIAVWASYRATTESRYMLLFILVNATAVVSTLLSNLASIVGILSARFSSTRGVLNVRNIHYSTNIYRQEDIPLEATSMAAPHEDSSVNTVTVLILEKAKGSKSWETAKISLADRE